MNETANILNNASERSLILLDEVGRGTSTFDGLSIAWALVEYLHENAALRARTLFATHYHELNELQDRFPRVRNARVQVQEHGGRVIFLRKLIDGGADHSYGIAVAQMAGLPTPMLARAREILRHLESQRLTEGAPSHDSSDGTSTRSRSRSVPALDEAHAQQMSLFYAPPDPALEALRTSLAALDPDRMTPIEALMRLSELKNMLDH
jgi:DNA mismatch repair protein MutS